MPSIQLTPSTIEMIDEIQRSMKMRDREQVVLFALFSFRDFLASRGAPPLGEPLGEPPVMTD